MKTYIGFIFLCFGFFSQTQAQTSTYSLCPGQSATLEVTKYFTGSTFSWFKGSTLLSESSNLLKVNYINTTEVSVEEKYSCILGANGANYDTAYFTVVFNPIVEVEIQGSGLCENKFATFSFTNYTDIESQIWIIDDTLISHQNTVDYLCGNKPVKVKLSVVNKYGCSSEVEKIFNVSLDPQGEIDKMILITNNYFLNNVDCGNSIAEYEIVGLKSELSVTTWRFIVDNGSKLMDSVITNGIKVVYDGKYISNLVQNGNQIQVRWAKSVNSVGVTIQAFYSNGSCENMTSYHTILINDYSPDNGDIYQKPNDGNVLIFPSGQDIKGLNFQWGYTDANGNEKLIPGNNRYYCEFVSPNTLNPSNAYWVETWFSSNDICRTRSYMNHEIVALNVSKSVGFHIFPNPVAEKLNVVLDNPVNGRLVLSDLSGILILSVQVTSQMVKTTLDLSSLQQGNYILGYTDDFGNLITSGNIIVN